MQAYTKDRNIARSQIAFQGKILESFNENEKYLFGLRKEDTFQKERSFGPGAKYKKWLEENPKFNYKK